MRSLVSQAGVTGEGIVNNMQPMLKEMFWKEADPGFACFPAFPRVEWTGEGWEEPLCVWQAVGSELKRLFNKRIAFYKQDSKLWFPSWKGLL